MTMAKAAAAGTGTTGTGGVPATPVKRRGRKPGSKNTGNPTAQFKTGTALNDWPAIIPSPASKLPYHQLLGNAKMLDQEITWFTELAGYAQQQINSLTAARNGMTQTTGSAGKTRAAAA